MAPARRAASSPDTISWREVTPRPLVLATGSDDYLIQRVREGLRDRIRERSGSWAICSARWALLQRPSAS